LKYNKIQSIDQQNVRIWTNWFKLELAMVINLTKHYITIKISFKAFKQQPKNEHVEMKNANLKRRQQQLRWWIMDIKAGKKQSDKPL